MDYSTLDDGTLVRLIAHVQTEALSELYNRYNRLVFSVAFNSVGHYDTAEEITQDVFVRVWEQASTYRPDKAKVVTWLTSIARHRAIDVLRRQSTRPEQNSTSWDEVAQWAMPSVDGPEESTDLLMRQERVRNAINHLPDEQKEALALAYFGGYTQRQIAERLDQPLGTIKTRIRLAMQKLREELGDE